MAPAPPGPPAAGVGSPAVAGSRANLHPFHPCPAASRLQLPRLPPSPALSSKSHVLVPTPAPAPPPEDGASSAPLHPSDKALARMSPREQTALLSRQRCWRRACDLFAHLRALPGYDPNPVHYGVLLRHLARARCWAELRRVWLGMVREDALSPSNPTYAAVADALAKAGLARESLLLLRHMRAQGVAPDEVSMNTFARILKGDGRYSEALTLFKNWCDGVFTVEFLDLNYSAHDYDGPMSFLLSESCGGKIDNAGALEHEKVARKPKLQATYNTIIDLYGKAGRLKDAMDMFMDMPSYVVVPDIYTFNTMINIFGSHGNVEEAGALLGSMIARGVTPDIKTYNVLMTVFASKGDVEEVLQYYHQIGKVGLSADVVSYRIVLQVLCERNMVHEAEDVIQGILKSGASVHEQSLPLVMRMYIRQDLFDKAITFFNRHCRNEEASSKNIAAIMDAFADRGLWEEAEHVFHSSTGVGRKDIVEYNVMIKAYGVAKRYDRISALLENMNDSGISPDECTYNSLIQMFSVAGFPQRAKKLLYKMKDAGFKPMCETYCAVITTYSRNYLASEAIDLYNEMKASGVEPNVVVYGLLIDMFAERGQVEEALHYSNLMEESGFTQNQIVSTSLIKAYSKVNLWKEARDVYSTMKNMDGGPDIIASNSILNLYANLGMVTEASALFDSLRKNNQADDVSYTTMMFLYKNMGLINESINTAYELQNSGLLSDCASYNAVMSCYMAMGNIRDSAELVQQMVEDNNFPDASTFRMIFSILKRSNISSEEVLQLESAYNDCRSFTKQAVVAFLFSMAGLHNAALNICEQFLKPELTFHPCAYNVAFKVYASCGEVDKAFSLFTQMHDLGLKPDTITYIHLAACYGKSGTTEGRRRINDILEYSDIELHRPLHKTMVSHRETRNNSFVAQLMKK